jgi:alpha-tubulin suppressor-like RCC1 family protein
MVAGGLGHSIALKKDSTVVAWGQNNAGQSSVPRGLTNVIQVSAGAYHSVALKEDGTIVTWGNNSFGQLIRNQKNPIESIGAGHFHTLGSW